MSGPPCGVLPVCKPPGPSSHQIVGAVRRMAGRGVRVGHAGTLDPAAAGVLPVCVGPATRLADYLHLPLKEYRFELVLGAETDTQDAQGQVVAEADARGLHEGEVAAALAGLVGTVRQVPPLHSARHQDGRRLYEYAREGRPVEPRAAWVRIEALQLLQWMPGPRARALCAVVCGSGTYVRSLCADLGRALGTGGHLGALVRCSAGGLRAEQCWTLEEIGGVAQDGGLAGLLLSPADALAFLPALVVDAAEAAGVAHGRPPGRRRAAGCGATPVRVLDERGALLAVARRSVEGETATFALERVLAAD